MLLKGFAICLSIFLANIAHAGCVAKHCSGNATEVVNSIYPNTSGNVYLEMTSNEEERGKLNCSLVEGRFAVLKGDHILFKEMYSLLLTAVMADKKLIVRIEEGSKDCQVRYFRMYN